MTPSPVSSRKQESLSFPQGDENPVSSRKRPGVVSLRGQSGDKSGQVAVSLGNHDETAVSLRKPDQVEEERPEYVDAKDWNAWRCIRDVAEWMYENRSNDVSKACEGTGWPRWFYYEARTNEYVQAEILQRAGAEMAAELLWITRKWSNVIAAQLDIAADQSDPRAATSAATFLAKQVDKIRDMAAEGADHGAGRQSRAQRTLDMLLGAGKVTVERITVEGGSGPIDDEDVIDVEARDVSALRPA